MTKGSTNKEDDAEKIETKYKQCNEDGGILLKNDQINGLKHDFQDKWNADNAILGIEEVDN